MQPYVYFFPPKPCEAQMRAMELAKRSIAIVGMKDQVICGAEELAEACGAILRRCVGKRQGDDEVKSELADVWNVLSYLTPIFFGEGNRADEELERLMNAKLDKFQGNIEAREKEARP